VKAGELGRAQKAGRNGQAALKGRLSCAW
jgi:hypothetical protein